MSHITAELPMDICNLFSTKSSCLRIPGCAYCANQAGNVTVNQICHRNTLECPLESGHGNSFCLVSFTCLLSIFLKEFECPIADIFAKVKDSIQLEIVRPS